jgi:hypothetical protein
MKMELIRHEEGTDVLPYPSKESAGLFCSMAWPLPEQP